MVAFFDGEGGAVVAVACDVDAEGRGSVRCRAFEGFVQHVVADELVVCVGVWQAEPDVSVVGCLLVGFDHVEDVLAEESSYVVEGGVPVACLVESFVGVRGDEVCPDGVVAGEWVPREDQCGVGFADGRDEGRQACLADGLGFFYPADVYAFDAFD